MTETYAGAGRLRNRRKAILAFACTVAAIAAPATAIAQLPNPPSTPKPPVSVPKPSLPSVGGNPTNPTHTAPSTGGNPTGTTPSVGGNPTGTTPSVGGNPTAGGSPVTVGSGTVGAGDNGVSAGGGAIGVNTGAGDANVKPGAVNVSPNGVSAGGPAVSVGGNTTAGPVSGQVGSITVGDTKVAGGDTQVSLGRTQVGAGEGTISVGRNSVTVNGHNATLGTGDVVVGPDGVSLGGKNGDLGGGVVVGKDGVKVGGSGGGLGGGGGVGGGGTGLGGLLPGAGSIRAGGLPLTPGSIGVQPGLGLFGDNPLFTVGGSAGMIAADSPNALRPGALGAYGAVPDILGRGLGGDGSLAIEGMNAVPGIDFPAGVLGIDPARAAAMAAAEGPGGALTPAALIAQQLPTGGNGSQLISNIGDAISSVIAGLPDWSRPIILVLLALVLAFGIRALWNGRRARRFRARLDEETERNEMLAAENLVMQRALVPALPEHLNGIALSAHYRPADLSGAGGDFYDVFALDKNRVAIILGDVSGHDRRAVDRANTIRHSLRTHLWDESEPRTVLKKTGAALSRDETLDGDFATAIVAIHDTAAGTLTYACAGHPAPVLVGAAEHQPVSACSSPALGWGIPTGRRQTTIVLGDGDTVCFYTDGLIEARYEGGFLGREGLERLVRGLGNDGRASDLLRQVIDRAHEADDDLAALILRAGTPTAPRGRRVEELEISDHDVRRRAPERFLAACGAPADVIEQLSVSMDAATAETGRAVLKVFFDPEADGMEALVQPLGGRVTRSLDPRVLVGD